MGSRILLVAPSQDFSWIIQARSLRGRNSRARAIPFRVDFFAHLRRLATLKVSNVVSGKKRPKRECS